VVAVLCVLVEEEEEEDDDEESEPPDVIPTGVVSVSVCP
jgi:hypothetical protein